MLFGATIIMIGHLGAGLGSSMNGRRVADDMASNGHCPAHTRNDDTRAMLCARRAFLGQRCTRGGSQQLSDVWPAG